jgi:hypothetical protein
MAAMDKAHHTTGTGFVSERGSGSQRRGSRITTAGERNENKAEQNHSDNGTESQRQCEGKMRKTKREEHKAGRVSVT